MTKTKRDVLQEVRDVQYLDGLPEQAQTVLEHAEDEIVDLRDNLRELLDRLADHRADLLNLDEVLAGPMLNQTLANSTVRADSTLPELWSIARDWTPFEETR